MVTRDDGMHVASSGETVQDDWQAAWGVEDEEEDFPEPVTRSQASFDEERRASFVSTPPLQNNDLQADEEDAWGWGEDNEVAVESPSDQFTPQFPTTPQFSTTPNGPSKLNDPAEKRNVTLSEKYWTSSIPLTIFNHIVAIYEDGSELLRPEYVFLMYKSRFLHY